jgi:hypothetical protein
MLVWCRVHDAQMLERSKRVVQDATHYQFVFLSILSELALSASFVANL